ncbi:ABC transporter permease [Microcella sp.]|uniref:ABC transporter permease n=1 Tax=Microcella sp. TaxID=1913979 RepID=UPI0026280A91|nr:ABC transporter permease [Microcella sp.]
MAETPFQTTSAERVPLVRGFVRTVIDLFHQRELLSLLVRRELKARYKDSSLGFAWSLIKPFTLLLIYFIAIGQFLGAARVIPDFAIFIFAGLTLWGLFSEIIVGGTSSIVTNAGLIKKVYLPREIFPLAASGSAFVNFAIQFGILLGAVVVLGQFPLSWNLLYIPVAVIVASTYAIAIAIILSALNVYLRDIQYLVEVATLVLFWASPIVYSWSFVVATAERLSMPWLEALYLANPVSVTIIAFQRGIWLAGSEERVMDDGTVVAAQPWPVDLDLRLAIVFGVGLVLLVIAQRVFARMQGNFAQEI